MGETLAVTFWPVQLMGVSMAVAWRFVRPGALRATLQVTASLLVFIPQLIILFLLNQLMPLLLLQEGLLSVWTLGISILVIWKSWRRWKGKEETPSGWQRLSRWKATDQEIALESRVYQGLRQAQQKQSPLVLVMVALLMGGFGIYMARTFLADVFSPRIVVEGQVEKLIYHHASRSPSLSDIIIGGQTFHATRDLHRRLQPGDYIRAEIGAGSRAVLRWEQMIREVQQRK